MMDLFKTTKGADACSFNGFTYRVASQSEYIKRWRCRNSSCTGKLWTLPDNSNPRERGTHNHQPDPDKMVVVKAVSIMKERSKSESIPVTMIHSETSKLFVI